MKAVQIYKDSFSSFLEDKFRLLRASPRVPNKASQSMIFGKNRKNPSLRVHNPTTQLLALGKNHRTRGYMHASSTANVR